MSKGQTTPFRGSRFALQSTLGAAVVLTILTVAQNPTATAQGHGFANGDVVQLSGVDPVLDGSYPVKVLTPNTFQLLGLDTTGYTIDLTEASTAAAYSWQNICELTGIQEAGRTISSIQTSTICSEEEESEPGLPSPGTVQLNFNAAPDVDAQLTLADYETNGQKFWTRLALSRGRGWKLYYGYISTGAGLDGSVNGVFTSSVTIQLSGPKYFVRAAA
ncbi:phage tail tube protein [Silvimonas sp.]|uniref:phage tail tube protein n=1 Tax=Silvimonas sp. TaxID=2650811 RepID=UPI00284B41D7|nr:phage tail tube protein [Silvimonas sp.]MDR3427942.1 phage tail tube protein [Silvimonas sp.]